MADENEFAIRYRELSSGPSAAKTETAMAQVTPVEPVDVDLSVENVDLTRAALAAKNAARQTRLARTFKPHWVDEPSPAAMKIRDSFDFSLGQLMLTELAIETGYLPLELVRDDVRKQLVNLLWSEGARQYLMTYDYVPVRFLAARVGVELGLPPVRVPEPNPEAETRFATFLSHHHVWATDPAIEEWLGFLDDYVEEEGEQDLFASYLETGKTAKKRQKRFEVLTAGADRFIRSLSTLFSLLNENEIPYFGLLYAYWIARFYGMRLGEHGYVVEETDWSEELAESPVLRLSDPEAEAARAAVFRESLDIIASAWKRIRELVESHATVAVA